jgi:excisionase family DNA binding protein
MGDTRLLKASEVAAMLGCKESTIRKWILFRRFTVVRIGRTVRVPLTEVDRVIAQGTHPAREGR